MRAGASAGEGADMKTRWEILSPDHVWILASMTLYGDSDKETDAALLALIRESIAIARCRLGSASVIIRVNQIDI